MTDSLYRGDVIILKDGNIGVVRNTYDSKKHLTCVVEIKGQPTALTADTHTKPVNTNKCIRIKLPKKHRKGHKNKIDFKKLSGEQIFDKLSILHEVINEQHIHRNKIHRLKNNHQIIKDKLTEKQTKIHDLRHEIKSNAKYLLLLQSIYTLTHPKNIDKTSAPVFLLTYPTFTSSNELLYSLQNRFFHLNEDDYKQNLNECQWEIQIKVISLLQQWIRTYWFEDFYFNVEISDAVHKFTRYILSYYGENNKKYVKLANMIQQTLQYQLNNEIEQHCRDLMKRKTYTQLIEEMKSEFQEINNKDIVEQICLIDFDNFTRIKPRECLNNQWLNEERKFDLSPNICEMINSLNTMCQWTQVTILLAPSVEKRGRLIKKFIKICRELLELNNFHSLSAIFGALRSTSIWKLKNAWSLVPHKHIRFYDELKELFNTRKNMSNLRNAHKQSVPPMVPYTGIFLSELVGIEEISKLNKNNKDRKAINFQKLVQIAQSIDAVLIFQKTGYVDIEQNVPLQHFLKSQIYNDIGKLQSIGENDIYLISKSTAKQDAEDSQTRHRAISDSINSIKDLFSFRRS